MASSCKYYSPAQGCSSVMERTQSREHPLALQQVTYTLLTGSFVPGAITQSAMWSTLPLVSSQALHGLVCSSSSSSRKVSGLYTSLEELEAIAPSQLMAAQWGIALAIWRFSWPRRCLAS
jgi:hypothetical protein